MNEQQQQADALDRAGFEIVASVEGLLDRLNGNDEAATETDSAYKREYYPGQAVNEHLVPESQIPAPMGGATALMQSRRELTETLKEMRADTQNVRFKALEARIEALEKYSHHHPHTTSWAPTMMHPQPAEPDDPAE